MVLEYLGVAVIIVGLVLMLLGAVIAWRESREGGWLGPASDFVDSLARLLHALGDKRQSTILFTFGTILVFLGSLIAGAGGLVQ